MLPCPVCGQELDVVDEDERLQCLANAKYIDENVWYCEKCGWYLYEEDLYYTTEEFDEYATYRQYNR